MKFFALFTIVLCCNVAGSLAQTPEQLAKIKADTDQLQADLQAIQPCQCQKKAASDDNADMAEAVARGFGSRLAVGPFREATLAVRAWRAEPAPAGETDGGFSRLQGHLGRTPKFTACQKATMAVIGLEMVNSFSPGTIPPQVLTLALQLQAQACGTPPVPVPVPVPPVPVPIPIPPIPPLPTKAQHGTGLKILPLQTRRALHTRDALAHRDFHSKHGQIVLPQSLDLRSTIVPPIEDQDGVGTCHDHSGVDTVCCANVLAGNLTASQPLSVQYIVDLAPNNDGTCQGGDASTIFQWLKQGNGIPTVADYGQETNACNQGCQLSTTATGCTISDWGYADTTTGVASVQAVQESLVTYGVTSICIGCPPNFMNYSGGIYNGDLSRNIDHQISLVGYTIDASVPGGGYWILRNSWGSAWGEGGYARISFASKPTTEAMWATAAKGQTTVVQPWGTPDTPTHRASVLLEKASRLNKTNPAIVKQALEAAETVLQNAP